MHQFDLSGQKLGSYTLIRLIGTGGMGNVYESYQGSTQRNVAIKILPVHLAQEAVFLERFEREVRMAARLEHPHILPIYDHGMDQGISYIVMRLLSGGDLHERWQKLGRPSLMEAKKLLTQIGEALDYAHTKGVIHRDLKARNILFDEAGNAYLSDFGIAKMMGVSGLTGTGQALGTPQYMAPELWAGQEVDARADVYAFAVLAYTLLTGQLPFQGDTPHVLMFKHLNEMPTPSNELQPNLAPEVNTILFKGMAKRPQDRYAAASQFTADLNAALAMIPKKEMENTGFTTIKVADEPLFLPTVPLTPPPTPPAYRRATGRPRVAFLLDRTWRWDRAGGADPGCSGDRAGDPAKQAV